MGGKCVDTAPPLGWGVATGSTTGLVAAAAVGAAWRLDVTLGLTLLLFVVVVVGGVVVLIPAAAAGKTATTTTIRNQFQLAFKISCFLCIFAHFEKD